MVGIRTAVCGPGDNLDRFGRRKHVVGVRDDPDADTEHDNDGRRDNRHTDRDADIEHDNSGVRDGVADANANGDANANSHTDANSHADGDS